MDLKKIIFMMFFLLVIMNYIVFADNPPRSSSNDAMNQIFQNNLNASDTTKSFQLIEQQEGENIGIQSLWEVVQAGGKLGYIICIVFIIGVFFICFEFIKRYTDKKRSKKILKLSFANLELVQIENVVNDQTKANSISRLLAKLLEIYHETNSSIRFNEEVSKYKQVLQERFDTFKTRMAFFSDTCGALGLLGTVWGMYITFRGGTLDPQTVIYGMGIALITTLLGLVASIGLNLLTTEIISSYNKSLDLLTEKSDEFQMRIIEEEKFNDKREIRQLISLPESVLQSQAKESKPVVEQILKQKVSRKKLDLIQPKKIIPFSGNNQKGVVMTTLKQPLVAKVIDEIENPLLNKKIIFSIKKGSGSLSNGKDRYEVNTDENGEAITELTLGNKIGELIVFAEVEGKDGQVLSCYYKAEVKPGEPSLLQYISGNYQSGYTGSTLEKPLVVQITDNYGNPIKDYRVTFQIKTGGGRFLGSKNSEFEGVTDPDGILVVPFILGDKPGVNRININTKGLKQSHIEFELFGQPRSDA